MLSIACTQDDNSAQPLPDGEYPMTFTAAGIALSVETKATTDNNWEGVQTVAVLVDGEMKPYTVNPSGDYQTATLTSDDPFYWQSTAPIQVSAWWPYTDGSTDMPAVVVQADQSIEDNFHQSDYICAENQQVEFGGTQTLQFTHRTAKVVVNPLEAGEGMSDTELQGATVALTGVSTGSDDNATVTPYADGTNLLTLLPGQQIPADEPFIRISLTNGTTYSYKPDEAITLQAGRQYTYTITVNKTGLGMSNVAVTNWDNGAEIAGEAEPVIDFTLAADGSYTVYTAAGLDAWADAVRSGKGNANCTLANNIDYEGKTWGGTGTSPYAGTFDGGGNTLSNMLIPASGLITELSGTVQNLVLDDVKLQTDASYHGLIAGTNHGIIAGCTVLSSCKIICNDEIRNAYTGGIAGNNKGEITRCQAECSFEGSSFMTSFGGIAGRNDGSITASSYKGSYNVTGNSDTRAGSLIGSSANSYATACWTSVTLGSSATMNGMIGSYLYSSGTDGSVIIPITLTACYWEGEGITDNGFGTQVTDGNWAEAIDEMNKALGEDFGWHYVAGEDGLPVLVKTE